MNKVYNIDCIEYMKTMKDNSVDLVVTAPPYLMNYKSNRRVVMDKFDYIQNDKGSFDLIKQYIDECYRVMKDNTAIYMFCSWHHVELFKQAIESKFKLKNIIVWNKNNHGSGDLKAGYAPKYEFILYAHKGRSLFRDKRISDVIDFPKVLSSKLTHPTEKPIGLLKLFIKNNSDKGDIVFDGFAGSGTTGVACKECCELDENYCKIANERIKEGELK